MKAHQYIKWLKFAIGLCVIETTIVGGIIAAYVWVERDLCPTNLYASGHCYAEWFSWFDWVFYCFALIVIYSVILLLTMRLLQPMQGQKIRGLSWFLTITMLAFVFISDFHFIGQTFIAIAFIHSLERYIISKSTNNKS